MTCARCGCSIPVDEDGDPDGVQWRGKWYCCVECSVWAERALVMA